MKKNVKDVIIKQIGIALDDLTKNVQATEKFIAVLNHCHLVLIFLKKPKELGIEINDKRLEDVASNLLNKCAGILIKNLERERGKSLFSAMKILSPFLDAWNSFLNTAKSILIQENVKCFPKLNAAIFNFVDTIQKKNAGTVR